MFIDRSGDRDCYYSRVYYVHCGSFNIAGTIKHLFIGEATINQSEEYIKYKIDLVDSVVYRLHYVFVP